MRMIAGDVNVYWYHDTLTPHNVRVAAYGTEHNSGTLVPDEGDIIRDFPGWDGENYEPITVRVVSVRQFGQGCVAFEVLVTTVETAATP